MKRTGPPGHDEAPRSLYVVLNPFANAEQRTQTLAWLDAALPTMSWRSHLYLLSEASARVFGGMEEVCAVATEHLERYQLASLTMHPLLVVADLEPLITGEWQRLLEPALSFQEEAYREQGEARLVISPILVPAAAASENHMAEAVAFFRDRLAPPILITWGMAPSIDVDLGDRMRLLVGEADGGGIAAILRELCAHHVFDSVLEDVGENTDEILVPCSRHLVFDETSQRRWSCLRAWREGMDSSPPARAEPISIEICRRCIPSCTHTVEASLAAMGRRSEGHEVAMAVAMALARIGEAEDASDLAGLAADLAESEDGRAAALLHKGLCLLDCRRLREAEQALETAQTLSTDPGLVAYHRGRVQVAWRDDIEALERYAEALELGTTAISKAELHLEMALSHVRLEEYPEARDHLEHAEAPGLEVGVAFNRGICELHEGRPEAALDHFRDALASGPDSDDMGRVLLYIATSLKELERFDEAIGTLRDAIAAEPDELAAHNLLGYCYYSLERYEEAVQSFRRALEIDPGSAIDWANLGSNLRNLGHTEEAITMYRRALELDPTIGFAASALQRLIEVTNPQEDPS